MPILALTHFSCPLYLMNLIFVLVLEIHLDYPAHSISGMLVKCFCPKGGFAYSGKYREENVKTHLQSESESWAWLKRFQCILNLVTSKVFIKLKIKYSFIYIAWSKDR